jgi:hypothetical protein
MTASCIFEAASQAEQYGYMAAVSFCLLSLFGPLTLAETDPWAAAVRVDEFDAGHFIAASSWAVIRRP